MTENPARILVRGLRRKSTGEVIAYRDDGDAGLISDLLTPEERADLELFTEDEIEVAKRLGVRPETLRGGA